MVLDEANWRLAKAAGRVAGAATGNDWLVDVDSCLRATVVFNVGAAVGVAGGKGNVVIKVRAACSFVQV